MKETLEIILIGPWFYMGACGLVCLLSFCFCLVFGDRKGDKK